MRPPHERAFVLVFHERTFEAHITYRITDVNLPGNSVISAPHGIGSCITDGYFGAFEYLFTK